MGDNLNKGYLYLEITKNTDYVEYRLAYRFRPFSKPPVTVHKEKWSYSATHSPSSSL
jgi:hypothetical protein